MNCQLSPPIILHAARTVSRAGSRSMPRVSTRLLLLGACLAAVAAGLSCSTTQGFGKDVKNLGGGIEDSAAKNK